MAFPVLGAIAVGGSILSNIMGGRSEKKAAKKQAKAIAQAAAVAQQAFGKATDLAKLSFDKAFGLLQPFATAGSDIFKLLVDEASKPVEASELFRLQQEEGEKAITRAAAARGTQFAGGTLQTISDFNRRLLAEETERQFERRFNLAQLGGQLSLGTAEAAIQQGKTLGELALGAGATQAQAGQRGAFARIGAARRASEAKADIPRQIGSFALGLGEEGIRDIGSAFTGGVKRIGDFFATGGGAGTSTFVNPTLRAFEE